MCRKTCFKCGQTKPFEDFYVHRQMDDGHLGKCKECTKSDVARHYIKNLDASREASRRYARETRYASQKKSQIKRRREHPEKSLARGRPLYAVQTGKITRQPCVVCGATKVEAHHEDYSKPLEVVWLCHTHHRILEGRLIQEVV